MAINIWNGATADWYTSANWSRGIPTSTSAVVINSGEPQLLSGDASATVASMHIGGGELLINDPSQTLSVLGNLGIASGGIAEVDAGSLAIGGTATVGGVLNLQETPISESVSASNLNITRSGVVNVGTSGVGPIPPGRVSLTVGGNATVSGVLNVLNPAQPDTPTVSTSGNLSITRGGAVNVGLYAPSTDYVGGAAMTIGGKLSNSGKLTVGFISDVLDSQVRVNGSGGIVNTGTIDIVTQEYAMSFLTSVGTVTTSGTIDVGDGLNSGTMAGLYAPTVNVTGGILEGSGIVGGTVNNTGGTVMAGPANSTQASSLAVGVYNQGGRGILQADTYGSGQSSVLHVNGSVHLSGGTLLVDAQSALTLNTPYTVATFTAGDLTGQFSHVKTEGALGNYTGNGTSVNLGNGDTLKVLYNNAAGTIQLEEVATPASSSTVAQTSSNAIAAAGQNTQTALLTQYAASNFAPASGAAAVVTTPQVATTPLLASPHHA